ncbi:MAG: DAK2 domain-containing protein [Clostridiales bacterium]|nr:DAK2 domain-containing protein [Clostridiales bacterium]
MEIQTIDAEIMRRSFLFAARNLEAKKEWINELNVFPVPDGDTGTNMTMTILSAEQAVEALEKPTVEEICKAVSSGSLRGARGNSGVILSQLFRGFTRELKDADRIDTKILASAMVRAAETAYKAVMKPKEGTILTVARVMAEQAVETTEDIVKFLEIVIEAGDDALNRTPEMLPVLKQARVVDSGGQGLMQVMKGARDGLLGKEMVGGNVSGTSDAEKTWLSGAAGVLADTQEPETEDIRFGYCTEFLIHPGQQFDGTAEMGLRDYLESMGDCVVVVSDEDLVKVHVHTNDPGLVIQRALDLGPLSKIKIDNMREEHEERLIRNAQKVAKSQKRKAEEPRKAFGFIAVAAGAGMAEIFGGLGVDEVIEGGQTMNPSTEDILNAISRVNADTVYVLPNNKNIILAAQQAASMTADRQVVVIPSATMPQGITAMIHFIPELSAEENRETMTTEMANVKTGQITYAVRSTVIDDVKIHEGDRMGLGDDGFIAAGQDLADVTMKTLEGMMDADSELISIYYGADIPGQDAQELCEKVKERYPDAEVELNYGGQPVYYYMLSVE